MAYQSGLTSANIVIMLSVNGLFNTPVQISGFTADNIFSSETVESAELSMGVDGKLSSGFVHVPIKWTVVLQADSDSNAIFDQIYAAEQSSGDKYKVQGTVKFPSLGTAWTMANGIVSGHKAIPDAKRTTVAREYTITWEKVLPAKVS